MSFSNASTNASTLGPAPAGSDNVPAPAAAPRGGRWWWSLVPLGLVWLSLFWVLAVDWSINSQYSYGWLVPFLGAALWMQRWSGRPPVAAERSSGWSCGLIASLLLVALFLVRLVQEANPEWRLVLWAHAFIAVGLTLLWLAFTGGPAWVRYFAFAACFPLISVPLPMMVEQGMIQGLSRMVATISTELAMWQGIPALQHGNLIEIRDGFLGVEEACSGVRSLQSSLLVALFLGEHYRFALGRRFLLVLIALGAAISVNIARTSWLVSEAARSGLEAANALHDRASMTALFIVLGLLFFVAWLMQVRSPSREGSPANSGPHTAPPTGEWRVVPPGFSLAAVVWMLAAAVLVEAWYRSHERLAVPNTPWQVRAAGSGQGFEAVPIPERSQAILRYSKGHSLSWQDSARNAWRLFYFRWDAGRNSAQLAKAHTPEICLAGAGGKLQERVGEFVYESGALRLRFEQYLFDFAGKPMHVFYCLWEDRIFPGTRGRDGMTEDGSKASRLAAVRAGKRHLGQTVLEVAVRGPQDPEQARRAFSLELPRIVEQ